MKNILLFIFCLIFVSSFWIGDNALIIKAAGASDQVEVELTVIGCNNNGICEAGIGETALNCPLDCSTPPPPGGGGTTSGSIPKGSKNYFYNVIVNAGFEQATIRWSSTVPTLTTLRWGKTPELSDGSLRNIILTNDHTAQIAGLTSGTLYYFSVESQERTGTSGTSSIQTFFTPYLPDTTPPQNPSRFTATITEGGVLLRWVNPPESDFTNVRLMRNDDHFRTSPNVGTLLYEGEKEEFFDTNVMLGKRYFYSLFSRDASGNYSFGTVVSVVFDRAENYQIPVEPIIGTPIIANLFPYFTVIQNNQEIPFFKNVARVRGDLPIILEGIPGALRGSQDAWVEVKDPTGQRVGEYLFGYDKGRETYQAQIPTLHAKGFFPFTISGYAEGKTVILGQGTFQSSYHSFAFDPNSKKMPFAIPGFLKPILQFLGLILLLLLLLRAQKHLK